MARLLPAFRYKRMEFSRFHFTSISFHWLNFKMKYFNYKWKKKRIWLINILNQKFISFIFILIIALFMMHIFINSLFHGFTTKIFLIVSKKLITFHILVRLRFLKNQTNILYKIPYLYSQFKKKLQKNVFIPSINVFGTSKIRFIKKTPKYCTK